MNKIVLAGGYIDFYVNKEKFNKLKTSNGEMSFVKRELDKYFKSIIGKTYDNIHIRHLEVTFNNFWREDLIIINDLNFSASRQHPLNDKVVTIRIPLVDITGVLLDESKTAMDCIIDIVEEGMFLSIGNCKLV